MKEFTATSKRNGAKYTFLFDIRHPVPSTDRMVPIMSSPEKQTLTLCRVTIQNGTTTIELEVDKNARMKLPKDGALKDDLLMVINKAFKITTTEDSDGFIKITGSTKYCQIQNIFEHKTSSEECNVPSHSKIDYTSIPCIHDTSEPSGPTVMMLLGDESDAANTMAAIGGVM